MHDRLFQRYPDAQPWGIPIGNRVVYHFGSRSLKKSQLAVACDSSPYFFSKSANISDFTHSISYYKQQLIPFFKINHRPDKE